jgi:6-phosphogluconolactonase
MRIEVFADAAAASKAAARIIAAEARESVAARGRFVAAFSGGPTPRTMLRALADEDVPWDRVHIAQVDERVAPAGNPDRNLTMLRESLLDHAPMPAGNVHAMPVEAPDLIAAAAGYAHALESLAGSPPVLDFIHLGFGTDGHTASLVPGDPVLDIADAHVAVTGVYQGRQRMTLTYPIINRARRILWLVIGAEKADMLVRLRNADSSIPAGRVRQDTAIVVADEAAAANPGVSAKGATGSRGTM